LLQGFLFSICTQISLALGKARPTTSMTTEALLGLAQTLAIQLTQDARHLGRTYYFVVDGLEWASTGIRGQRIIDLLPLRTGSVSPYLLASCRTDALPTVPQNLSAHRLKPIPLSLQETTQFFSDTPLPREAVLRIHEKAAGIVGHLKLIKRLVSRMPDDAINIDNLPSELGDLVGHDWARIVETSSPETKIALECLACSQVPLPPSILARIASIEEDHLVASLLGTGLVEHDPRTGNIRYTNQFFHSVAERRSSSHIPNLRGQVIDALKECGSQHEDILSLLYRDSGDYEGITSLLAPQKLVQAIRDEGRLPAICRRLTVACEMAKQNGDTNSLIKWGLALSLGRQLASEPIDVHQIDALLAVGRTQEALRRAYAAADSPTRIRLLARCYVSMEGEGEHIPSRAKEELKDLVDELQIDEIDTDLAIQVATELFPLYPDLAIALLEKQIKESDKRSIIDVALTAAVLTSPLGPNDQLVSRITDPELANVVKAHSRWMSDLPMDRLIDELKSIQSTKAKEYLLRRWCVINQSSPDLQRGLNQWLDTIIADSQFVIPLRNIREIALLLHNLTPADRQHIVQRLDIPSITSLKYPKEEYIRILLASAEALCDIDIQDAICRFAATYKMVLDEILDLDTKAYCLARLLASACRVDPENLSLHSEIQNHLDLTLNSLLADSGDHLAVTRGVIRTLAEVDPFEALRLASRLNLYSRRAKAASLLLSSILLHGGCAGFAEILDLAIDLADPEDQQSLLLSALEDLDDRSPKICIENAQLLLSRASEGRDPHRRSQCLALLASLVFDGCPDIATRAAQDAVESWRHISDLRVRISSGYDLVRRLHRIDPSLLEELLDEILAMGRTPEGVIASSILGWSLVEVIRLAIRTIDTEILINRKDQLEEIERTIEALPSPSMQVRLLCELAAASYAAGYSPYAERVIRTLVDPRIHPLIGSAEGESALVDCSPVLHEFDPKLAADTLSQLGQHSRDLAWNRTAIWHLTRRLLTDDIRADELRLSAPFPWILAAIDAASNISWDSLLYDAILAVSRVSETSLGSSVDLTQALEIARRLDDLSSEHLPDTENITHAGFKIIACAQAHRLRCKATTKAKAAAALSKAELRHGWDSIVSEADSLANSADRVFVYAIIAEAMFSYDPERAEILLENAAQLCAHLPSIEDRADRLQTIAQVWSAAGMNSKARETLEEVLELTDQFEDLDRRSRIGLLVQTAYRVDPDFAAELTSRLDSRLEGFPSGSAEVSLGIARLAGNPADLHQLSESPFPDVWLITAASQKLLREIVNGGGLIHHPSVMQEWLLRAASTHMAAFRDASHWVIESLKRGSTADPVFDSLLDMMRLTSSLTHAMSQAQTEGVPRPLLTSYPGLASRVNVFRAGERERAVQWLQDWIAQHGKQYVKVCDPYFRPSDMLFLKGVPTECKVLIVTTDTNFDPRTKNEALSALLVREWNQVSARPMPPIQLIAVPSRFESLFHDRVIVTAGAGLDMGPSLNGLGLKDGKITELDEVDAKDLETKYLDPLLNQATWFIERGATPLVISLPGPLRHGDHN
jgi:hypothetical protein